MKTVKVFANEKYKFV